MSRIPAKQSALARFAHNLRVIRTEKGLSQEDVAAEAEISQTFLSQVESGKRNVSMNVAERLSQAVGAELIDLLRPF
ncbi:MAG TPA: helix-turn-helix transcriptional regulator [Noviherbaspirillum sp.]